MQKLNTRQITTAALIGGIYLALSYFGNIFGLTYGPVQFRFSEALTVLPFLNPLATWGLFVGCILSNILSPYGPLDLVFGSLATLLAGLLTARSKSRWLAPLPPVICNGILVGGLISYQEVGFTAAFPVTFLFNCSTVALGELVVCYVLGLPLLALMTKTKVFGAPDQALPS